MTTIVMSDILQTIGRLEPAAPVPPAQAPAVLRMKRVVKEFPHWRGAPRRVLDGVDLTVSKGEFVAVVGPRACGKSTLIRLAAGLDTPTDGTVLVGGHRPIDGEEVAGLAMMGSNPALRPFATIGASVAAPFAKAGRRLDQQRVAEVLERVGISEFADVRARRLPPGVQHRAALARALALQPSILLLDDPFASLDVDTRRSLEADVRALGAFGGVTTLFVTANIDDAVFLADRVVAMSPTGRVEMERTVEFDHPRRDDLRRSPAFHRFVSELADALGDPTAAGSVSTVDLG